MPATARLFELSRTWASDHCFVLALLMQMLLGTWASDYTSHNKVLLFSHSTRCLDLLEVRCGASWGGGRVMLMLMLRGLSPILMALLVYSPNGNVATLYHVGSSRSSVGLTLATQQHSSASCRPLSNARAMTTCDWTAQRPRKTARCVVVVVQSNELILL